MNPAALSKTDGQLAARCAATASLGAAVIHLAVTPMHWRDWVPSGIFFAVLALSQLLWAVLAWLRPTAALLAAGIVLNGGAVALWVTSCVAGPPVGPSAGHPETVTAAGISVLLLQCYVVMGAAWGWSRIYRPDHVSGLGRALVLAGANTVMVGAVAVGVVAGVHGQHHHHHGEVMQAHDHDPAPAAVPSPAEEQGLPVTDMSLDVPVAGPRRDADDHTDDHAGDHDGGHQHD